MNCLTWHRNRHPALTNNWPRTVVKHYYQDSHWRARPSRRFSRPEGRNPALGTLASRQWMERTTQCFIKMRKSLISARPSRLTIARPRKAIDRCHLRNQLRSSQAASDNEAWRACRRAATRSAVLKPAYALIPLLASFSAQAANSRSIHGTASSKVSDLNVAMTPLPGSASRSGPISTDGHPAL